LNDKKIKSELGQMDFVKVRKMPLHLILQKWRSIMKLVIGIGGEVDKMADTILEVRIPASLLQFGFDQNEIQQRLTEWLVLSLFTEGHISSGKAARLLNISRINFLDLLRARGIAYINYTPDELAEEFTAVKELDYKINE
jgi:predicted HTH domain antitoxin